MDAQSKIFNTKNTVINLVQCSTVQKESTEVTVLIAPVKALWHICWSCVDDLKILTPEQIKHSSLIYAVSCPTSSICPVKKEVLKACSYPLSLYCCNLSVGVSPVATGGRSGAVLPTFCCAQKHF